MPLPVVHSFAGYSLYRASVWKKGQSHWKTALGIMVMANLADLDFVPGLLLGKPNLFHRSFSHSFGAALVCGLGAAAVSALYRKGSFYRTFFLATAAYASHIVLDFFTGTTHEMFWPLPMQVPNG